MHMLHFYWQLILTSVVINKIQFITHDFIRLFDLRYNNVTQH